MDTGLGSITQSCLTLFNPMDCSTPGFPVHHQLPENAQTHIHWVSDAIQPSHSLSSPSLPAFNLCQHQRLFQWVSSCIRWPQDWKRLIFIPIPKKSNAKECTNYYMIVLISHSSKVMLKIHQVRFQLYMNWDLSDVQVGFRKGRGSRVHIANISWIIEKA